MKPEKVEAIATMAAMIFWTRTAERLFQLELVDQPVWGRDMAEIINASDQLGFKFELYGRSTADSWYMACIRQQSRRPNENQFQTIVEGVVDIYENDLSRLKEKLGAFLKATDESQNFKFVPIFEPSFELTFERIPHGNDYCRVVLAAIDLKAMVEVKTPIAYGENRVITRFHTTEDRIQRFGLDITRNIEKLMASPSGVKGTD